jgi:NADPH-dependent 2,4-dienoyl-CoA reductase/sulfur reductase-like enzyme
MSAADRKSCDFAVIGGGPAGLAAAALAAELGLNTVLFDEQPTPGGQIYRNVEAVSRTGGDLATILGGDYLQGATLVDQFRRSGAVYEPLSSVWQTLPSGTVGVSQQGEASLVQASRILLATGAMERPFPIPGWTLPGVMGVGAAQTLLKGSGLVPDRPTVVAGSGPLVYLVAWQLLQAGAPLKAVLLTAPFRSVLHALPALPGAIRSLGELRKGVRWMRELRSAGVEILRISDLRAEGRGRLETVSFTAGNRRRSLDASLLLLHEGVIPNIQFTTSIRCEHVWDETHRAWHPQTDEWGATSQERIAVAGDGAGIRGAKAAARLGRLAALDAAYRLGRLTREARDERAKAERLRLAREQGLRSFLDRLFTPPSFVSSLADSTVVCRCEEISAGEIRGLLEDGLCDVNQLKSFSRCGMGQCQGRMCGPTVGQMMAVHRGCLMSDVGYYRLRIPVKPLPLAELAFLRNASNEPEPALGIQSDDPSKCL